MAWRASWISSRCSVLSTAYSRRSVTSRDSAKSSSTVTRHRGRTAPTSHPRSCTRRLPKNAMRAEYDFSKGKRGVYVKHFPPGATVIALDEDIRLEFPTRAAVNKALRSLARGKQLRAHMDFATGKRGAFLKRFPTGM